MNRHKFKCNFIKKINAVCCHLLHIAPLLPRITNNKFASPIVKNWHECHKHTNIVNTAGMVEYNRLQIGATPDYELFKNQLQNFLLQSPLTIEVDKRLFSYSVQSFTFLVGSYVFIFLEPIHLVKDNVV